MDNIKTWTGLPVEESVRMTEDRDKWRRYVDGSSLRLVRLSRVFFTGGGGASKIAAAAANRKYKIFNQV